ncbi:MAG TPA: phospho-sugar mutase [Rectinema sp.]|jgi:phosphoglucomutase|nr:phospho-sugar mutase [Spirochaetia bacterium]HAL93740.1 phospho-sugar mutase [Spirochaetaceae bacterium]HNY98761.1 phospho-sugar mutase [Rectinema sp.]HOH04628.1 phospho-sugar mutase [Rectinema sp.]HOU06604.1 phospho-sugar mutase [Rectinema sp.]
MNHEEIILRAQEYIANETDPSFSDEIKELLKKSDWKELEDRFYRDLEFGTGGLRGVIGGGFNRMNTLVVTRATQGLCDYIKEQFPKKQLSACIAYDSRRKSKEFSLATALVFAANGIKAYIFPSLKPTPVLSYAIRKLGADTGVVVTASHNPPQYNGYKAYWNDGSQVVPPHDSGIIEKVLKVKSVKQISKTEASSKGLLMEIGQEIDDDYVAMVKSHLLRSYLFSETGKSVNIVYSPLHGTGAMLFERIMKELGLNVLTVPEQREPDGEFPTVSYPNPEESAALAMAIELGKKTHADVVMATDPDADRLGIAVPDKTGEFVLVTGNQLGSLHLDYIALTLKELHRMPPRAAAIRTIVTTELQKVIAEKYGIESFECLTGFKWIADLMRRFETENYDFIYATEESYGHLIEKEVRDKDGISAAALTAEMTLYWRSQGKSLLDHLEELYKEHGYYEEKGLSFYFEGEQGMRIMNSIMEDYRKQQPDQFGGLSVICIRDVKASTEWDRNGRIRKIDLPKSDVIQWRLEDGTLLTVRPSGTEPKIKYYILCHDHNSDLSLSKEITRKKISIIEQAITAMVDSHRI